MGKLVIDGNSVYELDRPAEIYRYDGKIHGTTTDDGAV